MKEAGHADWSTRNQLQITGRDSLLTKGLIRASLLRSTACRFCYAVLILTSLRLYCSVSFLSQAYLSAAVSLSGLVSPWDTLMLQDLVSPLVLL